MSARTEVIVQTDTLPDGADWQSPAEPNFANFGDVLEARAAAVPSKEAFVFLREGAVEENRLTFQELLLKARAIASWLSDAVTVGERALLLYPAGLDFVAAFQACLLSGVVAVPAHPSISRRMLPSLTAIVADCQPTIILTTSSLVSKIKEVGGAIPALQKVAVVATDSIAGGDPAWRRPPFKADANAFLQYTSGSTSQPRGVMVSHENLLDNQVVIQQALEHSEDSVFVCWLPAFHDMGLIANILQPIYLGARCVLMSPNAFVRRPASWLEAISEYRATTSGGPNFAYELCLSQVSEAQRLSLDLSSWKIAFNGAEPVRADTIRRFAMAFSPCGFHRSTFFPCYGLAEATLMVSGSCADQPTILEVDAAALEAGRFQSPSSKSPSRPLVACGQVHPSFQLVVRDPATGQPSPAAAVGEICLSGASVTRGYWPGAAGQAPHSEDLLRGEELRTGDLGFLHGNQLYVTGRLKDLIIIRGRNVYPQDLERTVEESHPALCPGSGVAFGWTEDDQERIGIVHELRRGTADAEEVMASLRQSLAEEHELQPATIVLIRPRTLPKTSSGKVQRYLCRQAFLDGSLEEVARWPRSQPGPVVRAVERPSTPEPQPVASPPGVVEARLDWLRAYAESRINSQLMDERRSIPPQIVLDFGQQGLLGLQAPKVHGGLALTTADTLRIYQQLAAIDLTLACFVSAHNGLGIYPIQRYAQAELQQTLLPLLAQGRQLGALALTEEDAGSNPHALTTEALPDGDGHWRLRGRKIWSGTSSWAGVINTFVRVPDQPGRPGGVTGFVVNAAAPGVRFGPEAMTLGLRGMVQNSIVFDDVRVDRGRLLGEAGRGMEVAQDVFHQARLGIGALSVGGIKRCTQLMLRYARRRSISTGRLLDNPETRFRLTGHTLAAHALERLIGRLAAISDQRGKVPVDGAVAAKLLGSERLWRAADDLMQLLGGRGYMESNVAPQILRDARLLRIFEGPSETLHMFLGARAIHDHSELAALIASDLAAPEVCRRLQKVLGSLERHPSDAVEERWLQLRAGEVTAWAILLASVADAVVAAGPMVAWVETQFEDSLQRMRRLLPRRSTLSSSQELTDWVEGFATEIGDIDQQHAGVDHGLDPLLRRAEPSPQTTLRPPDRGTLAVPVDSDAVDRAEGEESVGGVAVAGQAIEAWVIDWLRRKAALGMEEPEGDKPLASYGLDSVTAVMLADDLGQWLGCRLEPDLAWSYPTLSSLARHLAAAGSLPKPQDSHV